MYKSGKVWLFAAVIGLTLGAGVQSAAGLMTLPGFPTAIKASADDSTSSPFWFGQNQTYFQHYSALTLPTSNSIPESVQSTWANASEINQEKTQNTFTYKSLTYDSTTKKFTMTLEYDSPELSGSGRSSYFDLAFSQSMASKTSDVHLLTSNIKGAAPDTTLEAKNGVFSNGFNAGDQLGGKYTLKMTIDPVKILSSDEMTGMYSSDTNITGHHPIFQAARTVGYNDFGPQFNDALLAQLKINSKGTISSLDNLTPDQKSGYNNQIDGENTNKDFVNDLNKITNDATDADKMPLD
ncbi:KxYKxGKxW signal peptide domain-containing protein [Fructobacillus sp. M158]|nr:KxYKxGKxW signal peptide domain-containing protein [Fructobacillus parabroussonetiae]